jgi:hypothetical protein
MQAKAREVYVPPVLQDLRPALPSCTSHWKNVFLFLQSLDFNAFVRLMQAYYGFYRATGKRIARQRRDPGGFRSCATPQIADFAR